MRFLYINTGNKYAPDKHLIDGLRQNGHDVFEVFERENNTPKFSKYSLFITNFLKNKLLHDAIIVGYGLPVLVPIARILSVGKIIFNATSSQYEANIISRGTGKLFSLKAIKWWIIDFISFNFSSIVLLESEAQVDFINNFFLIPKRKLTVSWMGVDEEIFFRDKKIKKRNNFTVLFRGRFLPESGILTVIESAKKIENRGVRFVIVGQGFMYKEVNSLMHKLKPKNVEIIKEKLPGKKLREIMLSSHISLGQVADHPRLMRTLPAKLYESLALGLPYLTGRNPAVFELLKENENCISVNPGDSNDLAEKIIYLMYNPEIMKKIAENGYNLYKTRLTSKKLAENFIKNCFRKT